jgi:hypothetical protein
VKGTEERSQGIWDGMQNVTKQSNCIVMDEIAPLKGVGGEKENQITLKMSGVCN